MSGGSSLDELMSKFQERFGFPPVIGARQSRAGFMEAIRVALETGEVPETMKPYPREDGAIVD